MKIRPFLSKLFFVCIALQLNGQSLHNTPKDGPATHGMLLFGKEKVYISHLPMFHPPHNYQIILEIELSAADKSKYIKDQETHSKTPYYTLVPEEFVLADMIENPKPFKADIFRDHFERTGTRIIQNITVSIKQVIYKKRFDDAPPSLKTSNYLLFGNDKEQYAAHFINKRPDFDDIRLIKATLPKDKTVLEVVLDDKKNKPLLNSSQTLNGKTKDGKPFSLTLLKQLYLEIDELK
jgi:hypothetical protein